MRGSHVITIEIPSPSRRARGIANATDFASAVGRPIASRHVYLHAPSTAQLPIRGRSRYVSSMCGRATLVVGADEIREVFDLESMPELKPRYNLAPTQPLPIIRTPGVLELLPFGGVKGRFINAKLETVTKKPENRCLVVVDGFYEWRDSDRQPFHFRRADGQPFALGGVTRTSEPGAAIVTCAAMIEMVDLHGRQPVVLTRDDWSPWLAGEARPGTLAELIRYPVSKIVNNWRNDDERCLAPAES